MASLGKKHEAHLSNGFRDATSNAAELFLKEKLRERAYRIIFRLQEWKIPYRTNAERQQFSQVFGLLLILFTSRFISNFATNTKEISNTHTCSISDFFLKQSIHRVNSFLCSACRINNRPRPCEVVVWQKQR